MVERIQFTFTAEAEYLFPQKNIVKKPTCKIQSSSSTKCHRHRRHRDLLTCSFTFSRIAPLFRLSAGRRHLIAVLTCNAVIFFQIKQLEETVQLEHLLLTELSLKENVRN